MTGVGRGTVRGKIRVSALLSLAFICFISHNLTFAFENISYERELKAGFQKPVDVAVSVSGDIYILDEKTSKVFVFDSSGKIKLDFGGKGYKDSQLEEPRSIALSPKGEVVVTDAGDKSVKIFDMQGKFLLKFGGYGSTPGKFNSPNAVVVDQFGFIFVADKGNKRIQVFTPRGIFLRSFQTEFAPADIGLDPQRNLYVLLPEKGKVVQFAPSGRSVKAIACTINGRDYIRKAKGIAVDRRGAIYITEDKEHSIKKFDSTERVLLSFGSEGEGRGQFDEPAGIASDPSDRIYVVDTKNARIQIFEVSGSGTEPMQPELNSPPVVEFDSSILAEKAIADLNYLDSLGLFVLSDKENHILLKGSPSKLFGRKGKGSGEFNGPLAFSSTSGGKIFVADTGNNRLQVLNTEGKPDFHFGKRGSKNGQFKSPQGVAINSESIIYVADTDNHRVQIFNSDGIFLSAFGEKSVRKRDTGPADGTFLYPRALAIDSRDRVYVLDSDNHRIQIFDQDGRHLLSIGGKGEAPGQLMEPVDIAIDEGDYLYVAERGNSRVQIFTPDGSFVMAFGSSGEGIGSFEKISAITSFQGMVYVADYAADIVQAFRFYPQGIVKEDLMYAAATAYPPHDHEGSDEDKLSIARRIALGKAVSQLAQKMGLPEEDLKNHVKIESEERLESGEIKVVVSIPKRVSVAEEPHPQEEKKEAQEYELK